MYAYLDGISVLSGEVVVCRLAPFLRSIRSGKWLMFEFDRIKGIRSAHCYASLRSLFGTLPAVTSPPKGDDPIMHKPIKEVFNPVKNTNKKGI